MNSLIKFWAQILKERNATLLEFREKSSVSSVISKFLEEQTAEIYGVTLKGPVFTHGFPSPKPPWQEHTNNNNHRPLLRQTRPMLQCSRKKCATCHICTSESWSSPSSSFTVRYKENRFVYWTRVNYVLSKFSAVWNWIVMAINTPVGVWFVCATETTPITRQFHSKCILEWNIMCWVSTIILAFRQNSSTVSLLFLL